MKKIIMAHFLFFLVTYSAVYGQETIPREYVQPAGRVSLSRFMPFFQAIQALSELSSRLEKKVIIDDKVRTGPINVDISDLLWRDAFNLILKVNNLESEEYPAYIKIIDKKEQVQPVEKIKYNSSMREVNISAIFFEGDKQALRERGINWEALIRSGNVSYTIRQNLVGKQSEEDLFSAGISKQTDDKSLMGVLKALESESIGEVLASPNIQVIEGEEGRVQVGQDFSIKQRDFAGNVTDNFISSGIILSVKPTVIQEDSLDFIHLAVQTERSSVSPSQISTIINKTAGKTSLFLLDGERTVIAGLYSTSENISRAGIPILKDLPGWFFGIKYLTGYDRKERIEKELIIILKAELVPTLQNREISQIKNTEYIEQKREELKKKWQEK